MRPLLSFAAILLSILLVAQSPQAFDFQGVARDASGNVMSSQGISLRISILVGEPGGDVAYQETHNVTTSPFGLFTIQVGNGTPTQSTFPSIGWGAASHFIQVELDASGGSDFQDMGTTQLLSVPYALHAQATDCFTVSFLGDTLHQGNGCHVIIPGISAANGGCADSDGDGFYDQEGCGTLVDCDDSDATIYPGATEICGDGKDNDCDGLVDNDPDLNEHITWYRDADGDGWGDPDDIIVSCEVQVGYVTQGGDCDDNDPLRFPGQGCSLVCTAAEQAWIDQNQIEYLRNYIYYWALDQFEGFGDVSLEEYLEEGLLSGTVPLTMDCHQCAQQFAECVGIQGCVNQCVQGIDGCFICFFSNTACMQDFVACTGLNDADGDGYVSGSDCDDNDPNLNFSTTWYLDADGDGYGDLSNTLLACTQPPGYVDNPYDCDDADANVFIDQGCPGTECGFAYGQQWGSCGFGLCVNGLCVPCEDLDGDGWSTCDGDCDDSDPNVNPGSTEICANGIDDNCDGQVDEDCPCLEGAVEACGSNVGACQQGTRTCMPGGVWGPCIGEVEPTQELCDGIDNDCDGLIDEDPVDGLNWYRDADGDGFGDADDMVVACSAPVGYVDSDTDCDDNDPDINPDAIESCNGIDDNCDGQVDEGNVCDPCDGPDYCFIDGQCYSSGESDPFAYCRVCEPLNSTDSWSFRAAGVVCNLGDGCTFPSVCDGAGGVCAPQTFRPAGSPCDDGNPNTVNDVCDGAGNCSGTPCTDADGDGFFAGSGCGTAVDCDDNDPEVYPGAIETCNGIDDDCDGQIDEGVCGPEICDGIDNNGNGLIDADDPALVLVPCELQQGVCAGVTKPAALCVDGAWLTCSAVDYANGSPFYSMDDPCDGLDNDCDGQVDEDINLATDPLNCGECGNACPPGYTCQSGMCVCPPAGTICDDGDPCTISVFDGNCTCVSTPVSCPPGETCIDGTCVLVCPSGQTNCGGTCVNLQTDMLNCGDCGVSCPPGTTCMSGACICLPAGTICDDGDPCTISVWDGNCTCVGMPVNCPPGEICIDGDCVPE